MSAEPSRPAARIYPPFVTLIRRATRGPGAAPTTTTIEAIEDWLLDEAIDEPDILSLVESLFWRLVAAGLPLDRASLHVGTLHPQLLGFAWNWSRADRHCDEIKVAMSSRETDSFRRNPLYRVFALHVERHIGLRIAGNVLDTYLGAEAGRQVLRGSITRGSGASIRAVIWASDLRGFTDLSDRLSGPDVLAVLNAYFERVAGAVLAHGGEVLKFIGDGLLAVFPFATEVEGRSAAAGAVAAAEQAVADLARLNAEPPAVLAAIRGWQPLANGIALHEGEVFFGNMGAPERLDFTVIGKAVNTASRVEALTKVLGRSVLITAPVAGRLDRTLDDLGLHPLRGLAQPVALYGLRAE